MGVLDAETRQQHLALVGFAVTVGVAKEDDFVAVLHDGAILIRQDAFGNGQPVGESTRLTRTGSEGLVEDDHLVTGLGLIEGLRGGGVLIGVDWVFQRGTGPGPALLVEDQHDELTEVGRLLSEKFDLEALGEFEELLLLLGRTADALHVVIACVALRRSDRGLLFHRLHLVPSERTRGSRQFLDRDILGLDHRHATGMNLDGDLAVGRDVRLGLNVIECRHAVNPAADTGAFGEDAVLVPLAFLHGGEHAGGVFRFGDDFIAAALVVDLTIPALTVIHLIAAHLGTVRDADATHLDAAVDEARAGQAQLESQIEILVRLLRREEEILRHLDRGRAATDLTLLNAPPGGIALPASQGLAVKDRDRCSLDGERQEKGQEVTHRRRGLRRS